VTVLTSHPTPIGRLRLVGERDEAGAVRLSGIFMEEHRPAPAVNPSWQEDPSAFSGAARQLDEYFDGSRTAFDLPLAPRGTPFQRLVWEELARIPFGTTVTYAELAARAGHAGAARAVGAAVARNPISIVVPCHRVVGADGTLTGYAGGIARKAYLLEHEATIAAASAAAIGR
jgi:methylated-DNA-[protein]-cysteine S-methyltransferase